MRKQAIVASAVRATVEPLEMRTLFAVEAPTGFTLVTTVDIDGRTGVPDSGALIDMDMRAGQQYFYIASGKHQIRKNPTRYADAQLYQNYGGAWVPGTQPHLHVNGVTAWDPAPPGDFDPAGKRYYTKLVNGDGNKLNPWISDSYFDDNAGELTLQVYEVGVDLDIDSDNDNATSAPARTQAEDDTEDVANDPTKPGKIVSVNDTDLDHDGVPDWADGFNADGTAGNADNTPPTAAQGMHFVPIVFSISKAIDLTKARLKLSYSASDPAEVEPTLESGAAGYRLSTEGALRLWTKDGSDERNKAAFNASSPGHYVPPTGEGQYEPADLTRLGFTTTQRDVTLYLEAVSPSTQWGDQPIQIEIDPDGDGPAGFTLTDRVRVTAVTVDADVDSDNTNAYAVPDRNVVEDQFEDVENKREKPGKVVAVNDDDGDSDGVADYADGFNLDGIAGNADDTPPTEAQGELFVPLVLEVPSLSMYSNLRLKIDYDDQSLRIWTSQGYVSRTGASFTTASGFASAPPSMQPPLGYLVPPSGAGYYNRTDIEKLRLTNSNSTSYLYVEALKPSTGIADKTIRISIDPDGDGAAGFIVADQVRFTATQLAFISDGAGNGAHVVDDTDPVTGFARIGHWGADDGANGLDGYNAGAVRNNVGSAANGWDNFIDRDPDRFYIRVVDPTKNTNAGARDTVTVKIGTLTDAGAQDDNQTDITLTETGNDTGVFISESQLLTAPDLSGVAATDQDDGYAVRSAVTGGAVADNHPNDRTHKTTIDGAVRIEYGSEPVRRQIPVSQRGAADERRTGSIHVRVLNEPYTDTNGNGAYDVGEAFTDVSGDGIRNTVLGTQAAATAYVNAQVERATIAWAQAGIRFQLSGAISFVNAPTNAAGTNIIADGTFDAPGGAAGLGDLQVLADAYAPGASPDVVEAVYVGPITNFFGRPANAFAPIPDWAATNLPVIGENSFAIMGTQLAGGNIDLQYRTLAHELWHLLANDYDKANSAYIFAPALTTHKDDKPETYRRIVHSLEADARLVRAAGAVHTRGNRVLKTV